jgi:hypothetical protein
MKYTRPNPQLDADGNWWGDANPDPNLIEGNIDYSNPLSQDPFPQWGKMAHLAGLPNIAFLDQNVPNPFNPATVISFSLREPSAVSLKVFNIGGQLVKILAAGNFSEGDHRVLWDGRNYRAENVSSGIYFYTLSTDNSRVSKAMTLLR